MDLKANGHCFECVTHNGNKCATFSGHLKVVFSKLDYLTHS